MSAERDLPSSLFDRSHAPAWERCFDAPASPGRPPRESSSRRPARPSLRQAPHVTGIADQALPAERRRSIDRATASPTRSTGNASASILWRWTIPDTGASRLRSHAEAWKRSNPSRPRPTATGEAEPRSQVGGIPWCARRTLPANIRKRLFLGAPCAPPARGSCGTMGVAVVHRPRVAHLILPTLERGNDQTIKKESHPLRHWGSPVDAFPRPCVSYTT